MALLAHSPRRTRRPSHRVLTNSRQPDFPGTPDPHRAGGAPAGPDATPGRPALAPPWAPSCSGTTHHAGHAGRLGTHGWGLTCRNDGNHEERHPTGVMRCASIMAGGFQAYDGRQVLGTGATTYSWLSGDEGALPT